MRLRYVEGQYEYVRDHEKGIVDPQSYELKLLDIFKNDNPVHIEIGCGKGRFIRDMATINKDINYLGFERNIKVAYRCLKGTDENGPDNYYIVFSDGDKLTDIFARESIDRIYLNFSDPWPKCRHYKKRLTHPGFLEMYKTVLKENGEIHMKTDNVDLFEYSVDMCRENGWQLLMVTRDLHNSEYNEGNVMTEYEEKFASTGKKINKLIARRP